LAADAARERAEVEAAARRIASDEEARALRERLAAESGAGRASLERLFIAEALPELARALATGLDGAKLNVIHTDGRSGPLDFLVSQVVGVVNERLAKLEPPG